VAKAQAVTADIERLLTAMAEPFAKQEEALFRAQCLVISRVVTAVIKRELELEPAAIEQALSSALEVIKNEPQPLEIVVNASDLERLETIAPDLLDGKSWRVETDHDLMPGGCRIRVGDSIIDASVEARLQAALRESLGLELPEPEATEAP
jgi:flagellar assembly protein FliH